MVDNDKPVTSVDRRTYLGGIATGTALGLAGCLGGNTSGGLEVLHGWTGGMVPTRLMH
nr:hypothetical protein [Natrinema sp. SYSU A 869]